ncbi:indolepyruvate oxidoreductase subunit beta family protein [Thioclava sp. FR2]|uniref:indolepyruvate oxidoreductase subunit beta family protein n=1 Tax=Thioclava sp. FR2 TaxID=3445780 RepID=UPI003EBE5079
MTVQETLSPLSAVEPATTELGRIIKLAVLAVGGQGGGVLTGWIEALARAEGYACQATSVAGVAQRTGATVYYIEMCPSGERQPVFSLMPAAGDVDILIAAEWMEAGRAIIRGFVTPDRTTLIASTHRALAVSEKMVPGDGIANPAEVQAAAELAALRLIMADFDQVAVKAGSVISASLFGALAASGALPFPVAAFENAIRAGGTGVEASLRAFAAGAAAAVEGEKAPEPKDVTLAEKTAITGPKRQIALWEGLCARADALPGDAPAMARAGLQKLAEFQGLDYASSYLDRVEALSAKDAAPFDFTREAAKYIANAMAYDDVIRVADLKTRGRRFDRIGAEMGAKDGRLMQVTEFLHPRAEEIVGLFPAGWGARLEGSVKAMGRIDRWFCKGRRIRSDGLIGFGLLYLVGGLRGWRLKTLRHRMEVAHLEAWLLRVEAVLSRDPALAVEILRCRRLIKGYSDTHARGQSKFDRVMAGIALVEQCEDAADWARRLREAALQDEQGKALDGALDTIRSFVKP